MSVALPRIRRASSRIALAGALAAGLLMTAPATGAHAAPSKTADAVKAATTATKTSTKTKSAGPAVKRKHRPHRVNKVSRAVSIAAAQKGDPYSYGASGPHRFDCSGLTYYSFRKAGFKGIPRTSAAQAGWARKISRHQMKRGDLVFFTGGGRVYHVGVFAGWKHGRRLVLHAPYSGARVRTEPIWTNSWFGGTVRGR